MKLTKLMLAVLLVLVGCGKATPEAQAKKTASLENPKIKQVKELNDRKYEVTFSMDFLDTADIRKYFTGEEYKALISTLSVEATEMQKKDGDEAAKKYMMEQLVDKIYSVYTEQLKDKKYNNEDSIITLEQQDDGKWFVTDIKDAKQGK